MTMPWPLQPDDCDLVAAGPEHDAFLHRLFVDVQIAAMPVPQPALVLMLDIQHRSKTASYRQTFPEAVDMIITKAGQNIGRAYIDFSTRPVHFIDIAILPIWQGQGLGTDVFETLLQAARARAAHVSLSVIEGQPAQRLYSKLGFRTTEREEPYLSMLWTGEDSALGTT